MCSLPLLLSLEAIERICGQERTKKSNASCDKKASHSEKKGTKQAGTDNSARVPKKARTKKTLQPLQEAWGRVHTAQYSWLPSVQARQNGKSNLCAAKKSGKKPNPTKQSFAQCIKPFDQPRDAAQQEECLDLDEKSLLILCRCGRVKGIC